MAGDIHMIDVLALHVRKRSLESKSAAAAATGGSAMEWLATEMKVGPRERY